MNQELGWEDLAGDFERTCHKDRPLVAKWFSYAGSEEHGIWLLSRDGSDSDQIRAGFTLVAAHAIEKLGVPPVPIPEPLQYCPHWADYCDVEEEMARQVGQTIDMSGKVPYGLETVDRDAVDPCSRAWLELLRVKSTEFQSSGSGEGSIRGKLYQMTSGVIRDICRASAMYCKRLAREGIAERLIKGVQTEFTIALNGPNKEGRQTKISHELEPKSLEVQLPYVDQASPPERVDAAPDAQYPGTYTPRDMYHATKQPVKVYSEQEEAELGEEWSSTYIHQKYPRWKYHRTGESKVANDADAEAALGEGWGDSPGSFRLPAGSDPLQWFDTWDLQCLDSDARGRIRMGLADLHAYVVESDPENGSRVRQLSVQKAFDLFAEEYFVSGLLTESMMAESIPRKVYEAAVSGGWLTGTLERNSGCTLKFGHYWVPENVPKMLEEWFEAKVWRWRGKLKEKFHSPERKSSGSLKGTTQLSKKDQGINDIVGKGNLDGKRRRDPCVQRLRQKVRDLRDAGFSHRDICERLGSDDRPPRATWRDLPWPRAYLKHTSAVRKWLSEACS
jgi:hypothetical protein